MSAALCHKQVPGHHFYCIKGGFRSYKPQTIGDATCFVNRNPIKTRLENYLIQSDLNHIKQYYGNGPLTPM